LNVLSDEKKQVLAVIAKVGGTRVIPIAGYLPTVVAPRIVHHDHVHLRQGTGIGDIAAIRRPVEVGEGADPRLLNNPVIARRYIQQVKGVVFRAPKDLAGVGRPNEIKNIALYIGQLFLI